MSVAELVEQGTYRFKVLNLPLNKTDNLKGILYPFRVTRVGSIYKVVHPEYEHQYIAGSTLNLEYYSRHSKRMIDTLDVMYRAGLLKVRENE